MSGRGRRLPFEFAKHSTAISEGNPIAFPSPADALERMRKLYTSMVDSPETELVTTGGVMFRRDGDGDIEMWVSPSLLRAPT